MKELVAFSRELAFGGQSYTELAVDEFSEVELLRRFGVDELLNFIVVEKHQTRFDQHKCCAIFIDHKLFGLQGVLICRL